MPGGAWGGFPPSEGKIRDPNHPNTTQLRNIAEIILGIPISLKAYSFMKRY